MDLVPDNWATYLNRGNLMLASGQHQAALVDFQRAAELPGAPLEVLARNRVFAFRALGDLDSAEQSLRGDVVFNLEAADTPESPDQ